MFKNYAASKNVRTSEAIKDLFLHKQVLLVIL